MNADQIAGLVEAAIPFAVGLYVTLTGYRIVGKKPGEDERYDRWHGRFGGVMKIAGPFLLLFSSLFAIVALGT